MSLDLQPAFVLHSRSYRETSCIVELFTRDFGRLAVVARGVRKARSRVAALLQPFTPLLVSCYGKGELLSLKQVEADGYLRSLAGPNLRCGFYMNELLVRLLPKHDPHADLYEAYWKALGELNHASEDAVSEKALRLFEKKLLMEIGYGLPSIQEQKFQNEVCYRFDAQQGFLPCAEHEIKRAGAGVFAGQTLNAVLNENFEDSRILLEVKRLMRFVLASLLGRPLESRSLFE